MTSNEENAANINNQNAENQKTERFRKIQASLFEMQSELYIMKKAFEQHSERHAGCAYSLHASNVAKRLSKKAKKIAGEFSEIV